MSASDEFSTDCRVEEQLPRSSTVSFLHSVGKSTVSQGMAVPTIAQIGWLAEIKKGQAVGVRIRYGHGECVHATLRRINNARGHLQFRYEAREQAPLREFLVAAFGAAPDDTNSLLRVSEVEPCLFAFEPVCAGVRALAALSLANPYFHNCERSRIERLPEYVELQRCLAAIPYNEHHNQAYYNKEIGGELSKMGWNGETRILEQIGLRCDYEKNGVWVEVEFGNARVYYQNYIKFLLAARHRSAALGVLLCPTNAFAQLLCDLGRQRAVVRRTGDPKRRPYYSGMMSYEKAIRELPFFEFLLTSSMVIAGIKIGRR